MKLRNKGQTWLITGISSGIGKELTKQLLEQGAIVIGILRNKNAVDDLAECYKEKLCLYQADIRDFDVIGRLIKDILEKHQIDIIVSNAGIGGCCGISEADVSFVKNILDTNLVGAMLFIKSVVPYLKTHGGKLIQIGSVASYISNPEWAYYSASKAGITAYCTAVAMELIDSNASVMIVEPGNINTHLWHKVANGEYSDRADKTDLDLEKVVSRILVMSECEKMPLYMPLGSNAANKIVANLQSSLEIHKQMMAYAGDVDVRPIIEQKKLILPTIDRNREIWIWSLGKEMKHVLRWYDWTDWDSYLRGFVDVNLCKDNLYFCGRPLEAPEYIRRMSEKPYVIVGSTKFYESIKEELQRFNYHEKEDFCLWRDLVIDDE